MTASPETLHVDTVTVACDGGTKLGHPQVYLNMGADGRVQCPYCSRLFVLKTATDEPGGG
jgi:uncharacterized Zn-finger protein